MSQNEAWEALRKAYESMRPGCMIPCSPAVIRTLLDQHDKGEDEDAI